MTFDKLEAAYHKAFQDKQDFLEKQKEQREKEEQAAREAAVGMVLGILEYTLEKGEIVGRKFEYPLTHHIPATITKAHVGPFVITLTKVAHDRLILALYFDSLLFLKNMNPKGTICSNPSVPQALVEAKELFPRAIDYLARLTEEDERKRRDRKREKDEEELYNLQRELEELERENEEV